MRAITQIPVTGRCCKGSKSLHEISCRVVKAKIVHFLLKACNFAEVYL